MTRPRRQLLVWRGTTLIGRLDRARSGIRFTYEPELVEELGVGLPVVSMSLPTSTRAFTDHACRPFFDGLLPEGDARRIIAYDLGVAEADTFAMLEHIGRDCAGALAILPDDEKPSSQRPVDEGDAVPHEAIETLIANLRFNPLGVDQLIRVSLGGVQEKLLLSIRTDGTWALPSEVRASTHILKPEIRTLTDSVINECVCLRFAAALGIHAARTSIVSYAAREVLVVERFDRWVDNSGVVQRNHQETGCQALAIPVGAIARKYEESGGPSLKQLANLLRKWSSPDQLEELLKQVTANVLVGNADAHGMNTSFVLDAGPIGVSLAPMYDVFCTLTYPEISINASMFVDGITAMPDIRPENVINEGVSWGIKRSRGEEIVSDLLASATQAMQTAISNTDRVRPVPGPLAEFLLARVASLADAAP